MQIVMVQPTRIFSHFLVSCLFLTSYCLLTTPSSVATLWHQLKKTIMKKFRTTFIVISMLLLCITLFNACKPVREFKRDSIYKGNNDFNWQQPIMDTSRKNIFVIADNDGTELFDMLAPFYLFNETGKANVYIIAKNKYPVNVKKDFSCFRR